MVVKEFKLPDVGEGVAEGELVQWLVEPGDAVTEDQPVAEVETDKALVEVPSPYDGTVKELRAEEGEMVPVGDVIITFDVPEAELDEAAEPEPEPTGADGEAAADARPPTDDGAAEAAGGNGAAEAGGGDGAAATAGDDGAGGRVFAPPSARRLARELDVDIAAVEGSGPGGRVTEADVRAHAEAGDSTEPRDVSGGPSAVSRAGDSTDGTQRGPGTPTDGAAAGSAGAGGGAVEAADRDRTLAAPATRRVAREEDVDIDEVPTDETRDGEAFVTAEQVREYAEAQRRAGEAEVEAGAGEATVEPREAAGTGATADADAGAPTETTAEGEVERRPYRGVRRTIGEQMERSKYTAPHVSHHDTAVVTDLVEARRELKPVAEEKGVKLTYMPFVMKAVVAALKEYPILNSTLEEEAEEIVVKHYYNLGVAVATEAGLMVPVVENVDGKSILELAAELDGLAERARNRELSREEMQGSTFTLTNFGAVGGEYATPIINYPETAILGLGAIEKRPVVEDDEVVARETLPLSTTIDHRVVDGAEAAAFTNTVKRYLNNPTLLLLE